MRVVISNLALDFKSFDPNLSFLIKIGAKIKNAPFSIKIGTQLKLRVVISNPVLDFENFDQKIWSNLVKQLKGIDFP